MSMHADSRGTQPCDEPRRRARIIVADDDRRMREFYEGVLSRLGHEVVGVAADGRELVDVCLSTPADLVLSDIRMPGMDGLRAAEIVARRVSVPFLFVSAYRDEFLASESALEVTAGHLVKPVKEQHLAETIPAVLRRFRRK